jgi:hypothetical protein
MEDVLSLYAEPADEKRPVVCFDETPRVSIPADPPLSRPFRRDQVSSSPEEDVPRGT